jgi:hypothetical protein
MSSKQTSKTLKYIKHFITILEDTKQIFRASEYSLSLFKFKMSFKYGVVLKCHLIVYFTGAGGTLADSLKENGRCLLKIRHFFRISNPCMMSLMDSSIFLMFF